MKHSLLLSRPTQRKSKSLLSKNMFEEVRLAQSLPSIGKALQSMSEQREARLYDFVGTTQFKQSKFFPDRRKNTAKLSQRAHRQQNIQNEQVQNNEMDYMSKLGNTTINRQTILSKLSNEKRLQATKDDRNIGRYKQYKEYWQNQSGKFKKLLKTKKETLLEKSNGIVVEQNQRKDDIVNNFVTSYWEMSLRNHNPILQRHIKGNKFQKVQLQQLLQRDQGVKKVENSIPILPIEAIRSLKKKDLSLTGRSRSSSIVRQNQSILGSTRKSKGSTYKNLLNQQQVYKISYEGDKKWMGYEGL